jgi:plasmid stabilization system protein ParE
MTTDDRDDIAFAIHASYEPEEAKRLTDILDAAIKAEAEERGRTPDLKEAARDLLETIRCAEVVKRGIRYLYTRDEAVAMLESALMRAAEVRRKLEGK